ncbi:SDR family NAD(P)-dependent oxidoreductase [Futiania mangrovi]|uniref:SDR family oxidoreductase n=1 Tax=Futiania mangrovi TaxID=2959716 RepID=A0A9J6PCS0_9PROT|nr:SDR family oxidoreductase [Futiania mangrovii]MCP1335451.1 SDR family oxidoreductase [Futiania mangrovii]
MKVRQLHECTAVVTGSTASIGFEIAAQLAEAGVPRVMLNGREQARCDAAVDRLKARAPDADVRACTADSATHAGARAVIDAAVGAFGAIDILVTSIPGPKNLTPRPFHELDAEELDALVAAHMMSAIYTCQAALPHMIAREGGVIINMSSDAAKIATPGEVVIGASKAGTLMFSRTLALEQSRHGIRVHAITPSIVAGTEAYDRLMEKEFSRKLFKKAEAKAKLGVVTPADIAPLAVFLCSPGAAKMTGQGISVNGGISAA